MFWIMPEIDRVMTASSVSFDGSGAETTENSVASGFGWHNLRHSLATFLAESGVNLPVIQAALRHAKPATTAKCIHRNNAVQIKVQSKFLEAIKVAKTAAIN